mmetsp:Transcript_14557/g.22215  ORF Transcript_14557/g.22215 Transcript_14557/m.22215 type:complete len:379 (-) Transcript_14557:223-1359(-)
MGDQTDQSDQSDQNDYKPWCLPGDPVDSSILSPTWEKLQELEEKRREILGRAELPFWRILLSWNGTCLRALFLDWLIWLPIGIYVTVRILARKFELVDILADSNIDILGGFLSFFLVLFVNQTNGRFFEMYTMAKGVTGKMVEVASTAVTKFSPAAAARLVRYMNAAHTVGYVGLDGPYSKEHFFNHINQEYNLLTKSEMEIIGRRGWNFDGFLELMTWCQYDIRKAQKAGMIDSGEARELNGLLLGMKSNMKGIYNYCDQPVHFFYIHFLCLLSALYLPLFALENALSVSNDHWSSELTTATIVILQSTFVIGLRLLGQKMVDPFGDDLEDLSVLSYVVGTIKDCRLILTSHEGPDVDERLEMSLATEAFSTTKAQI